MNHIHISTYMQPTLGLLAFVNQTNIVSNALNVAPSGMTSDACSYCNGLSIQRDNFQIECVLILTFIRLLQLFQRELNIKKTRRKRIVCRLLLGAAYPLRVNVYVDCD